MFESPKSFIVKLIDFGIPRHYKSIGLVKIGDLEIKFGIWSAFQITWVT